MKNYSQELHTKILNLTEKKFFTNYDEIHSKELGENKKKLYNNSSPLGSPDLIAGNNLFYD